MPLRSLHVDKRGRDTEGIGPPFGSVIGCIDNDKVSLNALQL